VEESLLIVLQFFGEVLLEVLIWVPFDWPRPEARDRSGSGSTWTFLYLLIGALMGGVSLLIVPHVLLPYPWLRMLNLVVAPITCGLVSWQIAKWRARFGRDLQPLNHLWYGAAFALGVAVVRFIGANR
jgi:hypothetical protein